MRAVGGAGRGHRRRRATVLASVAMAATVLGAPAHAQEDAGAIAVEPGSANASGQVARARLFYGGFAIQTMLGAGVASYRNQTARASAAPFDLSAVTGLVGVEPGPTAPILASSTDGDQTVEAALIDPPLLGRAAVTATRQPHAGSSIELAGIDLPGLLRIGAGRVDVTSEHTGDARIARATVTIAGVELLDGLVAIEGLRWDATHRAGTDPIAEASFSIGGIRLAGIPVPLPPGDAGVGPLLTALDAVLAPTGLVLRPPEVLHLPDGSVDITALRIGIADSRLGADVLGPLVAQLRPALAPVLEAVSAGDSPLGILGLLLDLAFGVVDGSGGVEVSIGGANAGTAEPVAVTPSTTTPSAPVAPEAPPSSDDAAGSPRPTAPRPTVTRPTPGPGPAGPATPVVDQSPIAADAGPAECVLAASPRRSGDCRGSNVAAAIAITAVAVVALAHLELRARQRRRAAG